MRRRKILTLSSNIHAGTVRRTPVPAPVSKPKNKPQFEVQIDDDEPVDIVEVKPIAFDSKVLFKEFEGYNAAYFELVREQVLRHQSLRTAISQVSEITSREFNTSISLLDAETDGAISEIFKINFLTSIVKDLNEHFHKDDPLDALEVCRLLFMPEVPKSNNKFDSKKLIEQLDKLIKADPAGPYGLNGGKHDKTNS